MINNHEEINHMATRNEKGIDTYLPYYFKDISSSIFASGNSYHYVVDFFDMSISNASSSINEIHDLKSELISYNDILALIHPGDMDFVHQAENRIIEMFKTQIGWEKLLVYKWSYCCRFRMSDGTYKLFQQQNIVLSFDEYGAFSKSFKIHTDISHLTTVNNFKLSCMGLNGEPSYTEIDVFGSECSKKRYTKREIEVLNLMCEGFTSNQIAAKLCIALDTAKNHRRNILHKAGAKTTAQAVKESILKGFI
ncbi:LuxR family transcriptional regulator [Chryseobacterium nematophagum]|uniref:LuxR family transcriptional regulator n=1 Tax=Chryseobacterium nematophagum TaxID=2305228 RepID=A0A3M7TLT8_9FLAO|nr:helix-turn-helix transcriptional regulator [Chryseobacterium nematophagum]RNA63549.1 LuxR family transcriptional regulator [Chryseobacterium nematophagum]